VGPEAARSAAARAFAMGLAVRLIGLAKASYPTRPVYVLDPCLGIISDAA
jgi:hypothetical protein